MGSPQIVRLMDIEDELLKHDPSSNIDKLNSGYIYAAQQHRGQLRKSGEAYLSHPLNVAYILATMKMDVDCVIAGLLHDTIEDTDTTYEKLAEMFGESVAFLVNSVSKINQIQFQSRKEKQAESFRKMLISMNDDIRVIIIKLADRLHNMRTIDSLDESKQQRIAKETMDIYAPIADRLGIAWIKWELEDRAFRILKPAEYYEIHQKVRMRRAEREEYLDQINEIVLKALKEADIPCEISGRPKHFYSIYSKMESKQSTFEDIYDLLALRVIVDTTAQCYSALGIIHSIWTPIPHRIKDYIAKPKANMYQSIHTTVMGLGGMMVEFQIRTKSMHKVAEEGVAAHFAYKEGRSFNPQNDKQFAWLREAIKYAEKKEDIRTSEEIVDAVREDILQEQIFVFTPQGHVIELPKGSTPIDFAYAVHTKLGHICVGARVNGKLVPLKDPLQSGDKVEIITQQTQEPRADWLLYVKTKRAQSRITSYLRKKEQDNAIANGKALLLNELKAIEIDYNSTITEEVEKELVDKFSVHNMDELLAQIGFGQLSAKKIVNYIAPEDKKADIDIKVLKPRYKEPFKIHGIDNMLVKTAKCCNPLPGDEIKGYISAGRGIVVHSASCKNLELMAKDRIVDVEWDRDAKLDMPIKFSVTLKEHPQAFMDISIILKDMGLNIYEMNAKNFRDGTSLMDFTVVLKNRQESDALYEKICNYQYTISVRR